MSDLADLDLIPFTGFRPLEWDHASYPPSKIQYACGLNPINGWLNVDFFDDALIWNFNHIGGVPRKVAEGVYKINLLERHPFQDNSFEYAFCEDFIEHIDQKSAILFLSEVLRTLKPGGVLRLTSPGLLGVMDRHFYKANFDAVIENHRSAYTQWGHLHFFTHDSLKTVATGLGFRKYRARSFRKSWHRQLRGLETRAEQAENKINIYAELTK
ncbi:methyltransferase domain-containing protein [Burkholderia stagnalis]|uniref:class I SAM-dependent methyltransferase n=1 Tax=Burkholderia stagnalis TaxID=1503054 RepID=UPI000F58C87E|nr:methyltransferase domain-containing protein [Burkholderia stagnalis]RQQ06754.1 methyltransferase domain-containing protein [Burkholderia stagnalis]RQQ15596.1 methyltransferase domain-containing protein [Burkholderia stagnalis]RQQ31602.1 methyltransferase domain-containing protein [Burkholderia stagnalis]RQQ33630.1 methyltransferase domain-containing protein [Burkholderia stagnalis]RQQ37444.1 methyltransferase domain-containing protein [Burkholderia stagnalis]